MSDDPSRIIRRHRKRTDDGKGHRRYIAGHRFRLPTGVDGREADERFLRIERLWKDNEVFCRRLGLDDHWTPIALHAAEYVRRGDFRVPLPETDDILKSFAVWEKGEGKGWGGGIKSILDALLIEQAQDKTNNPSGSREICWEYPTAVEGFAWKDALDIHGYVSMHFSSINWLIPQFHRDTIVESLEEKARLHLDRLASVQNLMPPDPSMPLITGSLHEALLAYESHRRKDFTRPDGSFSNSGHHMLGLIQGVRERSADLPLAQLDFARCQALVDFWRRRPSNDKTGEPLSKKTCQNHLGEIKRFFTWLHLTDQFGWRRSADHEDLNIRIDSLPSDRQSLDEISIPTFSLDELILLYKFAIPAERLLLVWGLNCAHGAAEFGRVEWGDLFLRQEHPWRKNGLNIETNEEDGWCGFIRPKSGVLGWWWLWPETIRLIESWRLEWRRNQRREPAKEDLVLLTKEGSPLYRDESRNAQTGFANAWNRSLNRIQQAEGEAAIRRLPFGTLRNQLPDWLGGNQAEAVLASVALCHGIPHGEDKLLYKHYANRPWASLFKAQRAYREYLRPMFDSVPDVLAGYDPVADRIHRFWLDGVRDLRALAERAGVSPMTVRRRLKDLGLALDPPRTDGNTT